MDALAHRGVAAHCVVVGDDENLAIARECGFDVAVRDNVWLGRKFNDGIQYALENGADWIVPIGSDDWIDVSYLWPLPSTPARTGQWYAPVAADRLTLLTVDQPAGAGPRMLHKDLFTRTARPIDERLRRGVDRSLIAALERPAFEVRQIHPLQYVGFRGDRHITTYSKLRRAWGGTECSDPWTRLAEHYPADLVERARLVLHDVTPPASIGHWDVWSVRDRMLSALDRLRW